MSVFGFEPVRLAASESNPSKNSRRQFLHLFHQHFAQRRAIEQRPAGDQKITDGVVQYTSAHVDYAESEFIVRSGHSCQCNPLTIEEVRRILLKNLGQDGSAKAAAAP